MERIEPDPEGQGEPEQDSSGQDSSGQDGAEAAFEALRAEVAALRRGIELLHRQAKEARATGPDYSPTLGRMEQALQTTAARLQAIERTPVLSMTPATLGADIDQVAQATVSVVSQPFRQGMAELHSTVRELQDLIGRAREQREQRQWLWTAGLLGIMGGVFLWFMATALLPWGAGTWLAGLAYGGRWNAGQAMLQDANPASWERMVRLYNACSKDSTTELCEAAMAVRIIPRTGSVLPGDETRSGNGQRPGLTDRRSRQ